MGETINFTTELQKLHGDVKTELIQSPSIDQAKKYRNLLIGLIYGDDNNYAKRIQSKIFTLLQKKYTNYSFVSDEHLVFNYQPTDYRQLTETQFQDELSQYINKKQKEQNEEEQKKLFSFIDSSKKTLEQIQEQLGKIANISDLTKGNKVGEVAATKYKEILGQVKNAVKKAKKLQKKKEDEQFWDSVSSILMQDMPDENDLNKYLTSSDPGRAKHGISLEVFNALMFLLESLDWIVQGKLPMSIKGEALEFFLNATADYALQDISNVAINNFVKKITSNSAGSERKVWEKQGSNRIDFSVKIAAGEEKNFNPKVDFEMKLDDSTTITIKCEHFNPFTERQGKADVIFNTKIEGNPSDLKPPLFKISAKNWGAANDFGETAWIYGVIRSLGRMPSTLASLLNQFKNEYSKGENNQETALQEAHNLAKYALTADLLMGYSQKEQSANMVVIHFQQKKDFVVFPILPVLEELYKEQKSLSSVLSNYPKDKDFTRAAQTANDVSSFVLNLNLIDAKPKLYYTKLVPILKGLKLT